MTHFFAETRSAVYDQCMEIGLNGDTRLMQPISSEFLRDMSGQLGRLRKFLVAGDRNAMTELLHMIQVASIDAGAIILSDLALEFGNRLKEEHLALDSPICESAIAELEQAFVTLGKTMLGITLPKSAIKSRISSVDANGCRILVVDDQLTNREVVTGLLKLNNFQVESVENGLLAVQWLERDPTFFDVILMDLQMPVMDGYKASQRIRELGLTKIPIIGLTAHINAQESEKCKDSGMNFVLSKPVDVATLLLELSNFLEFSKSAPSCEPVPSRIALPDQVSGIQLADGANRMGGDETFYARLLQQFPGRYGKIVKDIQCWLDQGELVSAERAVHSLSGCVSNLAMGDLWNAAKGLEKVLSEGVSFQLEATQLQQSYAVVVQSIKDLELGGFVLDQVPVACDQEAGCNLELHEPMLEQLQQLAGFLNRRNLQANRLYDEIMASVTDPLIASMLEPLGQRILRMDYPSGYAFLKVLLDEQAKIKTL